MASAAHLRVLCPRHARPYRKLWPTRYNRESGQRSLFARVQSASSTSSAPPPAVLIGGRYRVDAALGRGGIAEVFRVTNTSQGTACALKRVPRTAPERILSLFELEYQTLASLRHPHMVEVYEYGRDELCAYYTMELLEGQDLRARTPMPWREVASAMRDAALALSVLHARRLLHRDVSPRNLWRVPDGRVKLIDFGALHAFGASDHLIGTPPLIPPEALEERPLDQRADLYTLGATAYYLLSGLHAYPAREIRDLRELWRVPCVAPSAARDNPEQGEPVPPELDALILALLQGNPLARPSNTAELIDRLAGLLGTGEYPLADAPQLHLDNPAFVGRSRERRRLRRQLRLALNGRGQSALIESEPGMGRTRLLEELALDARVADALVVHVDAASFPGMYGTAAALALQLYDGIAQPARATVAPFASWLGHLSPAVRERLGVATEPVPEIPGELRVRVQGALRDWILKLAETHSLVVLVDGLERIDDGSAAMLLALGLARRRARLLVACSVRADPLRTRPVVERALAAVSFQTRVEPLTERDSYELLHSVFGNAAHLRRLASSLHRVSRGNPGHVLELAAQLVRSQAIELQNGMWVLPQEIPEAQLPRSREQALAVRLQRLSVEARALGRVLSLPSGVLDRALCEAIAERPAAELEPLLDSLCDHEIMTRSADGVRFAHEQHRAALAAELAPEHRRRAQHALGRHLLALPGAGALQRLQAGVHLIESGDSAAAGLIVRACTHIALHDPDQLVTGAALIERALPSLRAAGRPAHELVALLCALSSAGFHVDHVFATRYRAETIAVLRDVLGLDLAARLRRFLGGKLSLIAAIACVALRFALRRDRALGFQDALVLLFTTVAALAASSALCYDADASESIAEVLRPFAAFGDKHATGFTFHVCRALGAAARDRFGESRANWERTVALLEKPGAIGGMPEDMRARYLSGILFSVGIQASHCDDDRALRIADRLDRSGGALYPMSTDQIRSMYHGHQGNAALYRHYRERAEQRAIQQGAIWQNETWALLVESIVSQRHHDAMSLKRVSQQLQRASAAMPTLSVYADRARGAYLLARGRHTQALVWLERCMHEQPRETFIWGRAHGQLARAYNELGRHADARSVCARVLAEYSPADLVFTALTLPVQTEALIASAGLGEHAAAAAGLEALMARLSPLRNPLTSGELHEAGMRIALLAGDDRVARAHFEQMRLWYGSTNIPPLIQHCEVIAARVLPGTPRSTGLDGGELDTFARSDVLSTEAFLTVHDGRFPRVVERMLRVLCEQLSCEHAVLFTVDEDAGCSTVATLGQLALGPEVERWLAQHVAEESMEKPTALVSARPAPAAAASDLLEAGGWHYRACAMFSSRASATPIHAVALFAARAEPPPRCPAALLQRVSLQLERASAPQ